MAVNDSETDEVVQSAVATIYVKDPATGEFNSWIGSAFGQNNPFSIPDGLSVILPEGEYYISISAPGYDTINSLIIEIEEQSIVTAPIALVERGNILGRFVGLFSIGGVSENFTLNVAPLPQKSLLELGEVVPEISAETDDGRQTTLLSGTSSKSTVLFVYNNWNTEAQEQLDIYRALIGKIGAQYNFVPVTTMEPDNINLTQLNRGRYDIEFYKPNNQFFDDYNIISLPHFFILNEDRELIGEIVGSHTANELVELIDGFVSQ